MKIILFTTDFHLFDELKMRHSEYSFSLSSDTDTLHDLIRNDPTSIVLIDYDSVASEFNKLVAANALYEKMIVVEKAPEIATGVMLISHNVKAYANTRISKANFNHMVQNVAREKIWTYPELTVALIRKNKTPKLDDDAKHLLENRLTQKEIEVVYLILEGLTNDAIATALDITTRTVKAHISSIFTKLHINDRLSLVLLLK